MEQLRTERDVGVFFLSSVNVRRTGRRLRESDESPVCSSIDIKEIVTIVLQFGLPSMGDRFP